MNEARNWITENGTLDEQVDHPSKEFLEIFEKLDSTINGELIEKAWKQFDTVGQQVILESFQGQRKAWMTCAFYTTVWQSTPLGQETICKYSVSKLLNICNLSILEFFDKLNKWAEMIVASRRLLDHINRVQSSLAVSTVIYKKFLPIFRRVFLNPERSSPTKVLKRESNPLQQLTLSNIFEFIWIMFIALKKQFISSGDDLINSYHLLLCVVELVFEDVYEAKLTHLFNQDFGKAVNSESGESSVLENLCSNFDGVILDAKHFRAHWLFPRLRKLADDGVLVGSDSDGGILANFTINRDAFDALYEESMLKKAEVDERIFITSATENIDTVFNEALDANGITTLKRYNLDSNWAADTELLLRMNAQNCIEKLNGQRSSQDVPFMKPYMLTTEQFCSMTGDFQGSSMSDVLSSLTLSDKEKTLSKEYIDEKNSTIEKFLSWTEQDQTDFVKSVLQRMCHHQHSQINHYLKPMLQRDFITLLPSGLAENVLSLLDAQSLCACARVCRAWRRTIAHGMLWRKLIERKIRTDSMWRGLSEKRGWKKFFFISKERATYLIALARKATPEQAEQLQRSHPDPHEFQHLFYRELYPQIVRDIVHIENNWRQGNHHLQRINCESENSKGVYCLQYDDEKVISGLRDNTIKIWRRSDLSCTKTLTSHSGSVLCLQYDDQIIASGSSDASVRIWDVNTGELLNTLIHHGEAVLHLRFQNGMLVTCSKDRSIAVWDMVSPTEINIRRVLVGHRAAVNVVDFDENYIVSASGDRTIKVWSADSCEFVRTLNGHRRGIACLQYRERLIVSGSSDFSIRLWDIECGTCLRVLEGHEELVRCIRFDSKRIVSGAYDGKIKVWDLQAALDNRTPPNSICINTLSEHTGRVFRLQFDEFQIVSSSHDDTILIWDFLNTGISPVFQPMFSDGQPSLPPPNYF